MNGPERRSRPLPLFTQLRAYGCKVRTAVQCQQRKSAYECKGRRLAPL